MPTRVYLITGEAGSGNNYIEVVLSWQTAEFLDEISKLPLRLQATLLAHPATQESDGWVIVVSSHSVFALSCQQYGFDKSRRKIC
jgi:hypothetical protein